MPFQAPSWTEFYTCPICENEFSINQRLPISLGCGHTICRVCLATVYNRQCPFDQTSISTDVDNLPINNALLQLLNSGDGSDNNGTGDGKANYINSQSSSASNAASTSTKGSGSGSIRNANNNYINKGYGNMRDSECTAADLHMPPSVRNLKPEDLKCYKSAKKCIEELAQYLKSFVTNCGNTILTRPMLRKLVTLVNCQLMEEEGRIRAVRTARFLGERTVTELLLQHQNPQQLSLCLWAAVRSRGCQFLGPSMQEEVLKLVLQALQNGTALSRKVLVMYVVQRLIENMLPASKTSIGHVVQLLYRASCFKVSKREGDSSLMQLKEEFRNYECLRREHDAQIVQIATEAGLRIAPDQWSSLLYGNTSHKSHMQSICDTLQTPSSFAQSVQELVLALQRTGDPTNLSNLRPHLKHLACIDPLPETTPPTWQDVEKALDAVRYVVLGLVKFIQYQSNRKVQDYSMPPLNANGKYKISLCRDLVERRMCPRGTNCTFAHSAEERQRYRAKHRRTDKNGSRPHTSNAVAHSSSLQTLDNMKNEYPTNPQLLHSTLGPPPHMSQQNSTLNNSSDNGNSPVRLKPSPMRKYNNTNDNIGNVNIMCSNMMEPSGFVGDLSTNTSPLQMQSSSNALHGSPVPGQGHLLGITAPGSIIHVPPMQKQNSHSYENMPPHFSPINFSGKYVRVPNMRMPVMPNMRPPSLRGPISGGMISAGGGGQSGQGIQSPRSSVHNPINITTVVNPPNLQGTNSNNPPGSPLHKNMYNNTTISVDFYNTGPPHPPPSYFANMDSATLAEYPYRLPRTKMQKAQNTLWDVPPHQQLHQQPCQPLINNSEFTPNHQHHHMFMQHPPHQNQQHQQQHTSTESNAYLDRNATDINKLATKSNLSDSAVSSDTFVFKHSGSNKSKPKMQINQMHDKPNIYWHLNNNNNNQKHNPHNNNNSNNNNNNNHYGNASSDAPIEATATSLFRDRDSFVRSDSILDDDAATFDVPSTSTGNKYGPICPMYKGLSLSLPSQSTNSFVDSWNALISQTNDDNQCEVTPSHTNNIKDFTVFSMDDDNALKMKIASHSAHSPSDHFNDPHISASGSADSTVASSQLSNFDNMQAALSKLSFIDDSGSDQQQQNLNHFDFDLNSMYNILGGQNYHTNITKNSSINDDLLWNNAGVNNTKTTGMNLGLNSFWSDNVTVTTTSCTTPSTTHIGNNISLLSHQQQNQDQQQQRQSQKLDDNELDITEIVDHIWPCGDDSGIKLD